MIQARSTSATSPSSNNPLCIVITGASSGLGAGLARSYAAPGRILGLTGRNAVRLAAVADSCRKAGAIVESAVLDVTDATAMANWLLTLDATNPVDLLIANAGITAGTSPEGRRERPEAACEVVQTNLLGVMHSVGPLLPSMVKRGRGQIAMVASMAAYRGLPDTPAYCASKAGVLAYAESLRCALERRGVRVSLIVPGFFASPMSTRFHGSKLFLMSEARTVARITRGLQRQSRRIVFPWQLALLLRLVNMLPAWCGDRIMRTFRYRIADKSDETLPSSQALDPDGVSGAQFRPSGRVTQSRRQA